MYPASRRLAHHQAGRRGDRFYGRDHPMFHKRIVLSQLPLARVLLSGLNATEATTSVWPVRVAVVWPVFTSHNRAVLSWLPLAKVLPSRLNATEVTISVWP